MANNGKSTVHRESVEKALRLIIKPGQITELRAFDAVLNGDRYAHKTVSGYFDDPGKLAIAAEDIRAAKGIYVIPNPINPSLLARAANRIRPVKNEPLTSDRDIERRTYLLIDADPVRPAGISSTETEHAAAIARVKLLREWLTDQGWPDPMLADSGNGGHGVYRVDLPTDDGGLLHRCLPALASRFSDDAVKIDTTVHNAARIWKLYGSLAAKGDSTADRPHRIARIIDVPEKFEVVPKDLLEKLAAQAREPPNAASGSSGSATAESQKLDLAAWIGEHKLDVRGPEDWQGGRRWVFKVCPWNSDHTDGSAYVVQLANGAIGAGCHHKGCQGKGWHELRDAVEPGWRERFVDWPDPSPLPSAVPAVMPFDPELLPEAFRPWVMDIAERVQCPPDFPAVGAMVALAGVTGRRIGIRPKRHDDWLVVPNLWGAVIGRPGIMKTPALQETLRPLVRLEIEAAQRFTEKQRQFAAAEMVREVQAKLSKKAIESALKKGQDAESIAAGLSDDNVHAPCRRRYVVNDTSVEKLGEILNQNPNGVLCMRDELVGLLKQLEREGQEAARAFYLEAWNGTGRFTYDRIGRGTIDIEAACLSIIGGIQPGPLSEYIRGARDQGAGDDGFMQRFQLGVYPDLSSEWVNVDRWPDTAAKNHAYEVFRRIDNLDAASIGATKDEDDPAGIPFVRFLTDAQDVFDQWRAKLERQLRSDTEPTVIEAHLAKYRSLIPSLALLIHLADDGRGSVGLPALEKAIRWGEYLLSHARRIFAVAPAPALVSAHVLAEKIVEGKLGTSFALKDVYRPCWSELTTREAAEAAVGYLMDLDWLREQREKTGGAPRTRYLVNPKIAGLPKGGTAKTATSPPESVSSPTFGSSGSADLGQCAEIHESGVRNSEEVDVHPPAASPGTVPDILQTEECWL